MIDSATRGSRWLFLAFSEVSPVHIRSRSPSSPTQTGTLWGEPSGISVARCAKLRASIKDLMSSESGLGILILRSNFTAQRETPIFPSEYKKNPPFECVRRSLGLHATSVIFARRKSTGILLSFGWPILIMNLLSDVLSLLTPRWWILWIATTGGITATCMRVFETEKSRPKRAERKKETELRALTERI